MGLGRLQIIDKSEKRWRDYLRILVGQVASAEPDAIAYLFGSFLQDDFNAESDIDLAVILPKGIDKQSFLTKWRQFPAFVDWPFDLVVFEREQFEKKKNVGGVAFEIREDGVELYPTWRLT